MILFHLLGVEQMATGFNVVKNADGSVTASSTADAATLGAVNWAAILQAIVAALSAILAIISAFTGTTVPPASEPKK